MRLAPRLALLFLAAGLVPLGVTLLVLVPHGEDALRTSAKLLHQSELEGLRARVDGALDELMSDVRIVSTAHATEADEVERRARLRFLLDKHQEVTIATLFADGQEARRRAGVRSRARHRRRSRGARAAGAAARRRRTGGERVLSVGAAARDADHAGDAAAGGHDRYLATEVSLRRVQELIEHTRVGRRGIAYIVDDRGRLVAHPDRDARAGARERVVDPDRRRAGAQHRSRVERRTRSPSSPTSPTTAAICSGAYAPLGRLRWGLVVSEPREDAYGLARATWAHAGGWTALALALSLVVAFFFARDITTPVARLMEGTRGLAAGAFGISVPVEGPPEIAELARTFNEASQKLDQYDADNRKLLLAVERGYLEVLRALVNAIEAKDPYTAGHSQRTAEFAVAIGRAAQADAGRAQGDRGRRPACTTSARSASPSRSCASRRSSTTPRCASCAAIPPSATASSSDIQLLTRIRSMVRNHHERYDGSGYPDGLKGDDIPLGARIIAVADTYDAITSDRCYQPGRPPLESVPILRRLAGVQLDAACVDALLAALVEMGQLGADDIAQPPAAERAGADATAADARDRSADATPPNKLN